MLSEWLVLRNRMRVWENETSLKAKGEAGIWSLWGPWVTQKEFHAETSEFLLRVAWFIRQEITTELWKIHEFGRPEPHCEQTKSSTICQILLCYLLTRENDSWFQGLKGDQGLSAGGPLWSTHAHWAWEEGPCGCVWEPHQGERKSTWSAHSSELMLLTSGPSISTSDSAFFALNPVLRAIAPGAMPGPMLCPRRKGKSKEEGNGCARTSVNR